MSALKKLKEQIEVAQQLEDTIHGLRVARRFVTDAEKRAELIAMIDEKKQYLNFTLDAIKFGASKLNSVELGDE